MTFKSRSKETIAGYDEETGEILNLDEIRERQNREKKRASRVPTSTADEPSEDERSKNKNFIQAYPKGFVQMRHLIETSQSYALVYLFLVENMGPSGVIAAPVELIARELNYNEKTVRRAIKFLEDKSLIVSLKVGTSKVYAIDPEAFWNSYDESKAFAAFNTRTLADRDGTIRRRIKTLATESKEALAEAKAHVHGQPDLFARKG